VPLPKSRRSIQIIKVEPIKVESPKMSLAEEFKELFTGFKDGTYLSFAYHRFSRLTKYITESLSPESTPEYDGTTFWEPYGANDPNYSASLSTASLSTPSSSPDFSVDFMGEKVWVMDPSSIPSSPASFRNSILFAEAPLPKVEALSPGVKTEPSLISYGPGMFTDRYPIQPPTIYNGTYYYEGGKPLPYDYSSLELHNLPWPGC